MSVFGPSVTAPPDASAAAWIAPRLGEFGTVGGLVPEGFDAHLVVRNAEPDDPPSDELAAVETIAEVAHSHTGSPDRIYFAIWEGYGWTTRTSVDATRAASLRHMVAAWTERRRLTAQERRSEALGRALLQLPRLELPQRRYHLVTGRLAAATALSDPADGGPQLPDLWWPEDRKWFVATDTDLDWTCVAGSEQLVDQLAASFPRRSARVDRDLRNDLVEATVR